MTNIKKSIPGIVFVLTISLISMLLDDLFGYIFLEALTIAIIIGIVYNNTIGTQNIFKDGIKYSLNKLLKIGIVLLGFNMNVHAIVKLGPIILTMVLVFVPVALILSIILGKVFKVDKKLSALIGVGSSICGASAVVAIAPSIDAEVDDSIIAVSIVSFLGAIGVLGYISFASSISNLSPIQYGAWSGISLQGVAHALAAAFALGDTAGEVGTFVKMTRVLMLVPVSLLLGLIFNKENASSKKAKFPMYVLFFILAGIINSFGIIPISIIKILTQISTLFILMAMTAMGLSVNFKSIVNKGIKALLVGTILFVILSTSSLVAIIHFL